MGDFKILLKDYLSNFRSFWQHLTRLWLSEAKSSLSVAKLPGTMTSKSELMDRLKITSIGSLWNFRSFEHRLIVHQSASSSSRWNQVYWRQDPIRLQNSNKSPWLVLSTPQEASLQFSGHSDIVWLSFGFWWKIGKLCTTKSSAFLEKWKLCALIYKDYPRVFSMEIRSIHVRKMSEKIPKKKEMKKKSRNDKKSTTERGNIPHGRRRP